METCRVGGNEETIAQYLIPTVPVGLSYILFDPKQEQFVLHDSQLKILPNFSGLNSENPYSYLEDLADTCRLMYNGQIPLDRIQLKLFRFSFRENALKWYKNIPKNSIKTGNDMIDCFLEHYYPPSHLAEARKQIYNFIPESSEAYHEAGYRFNKILRDCRSHGIHLEMIIIIFYTSLKLEWNQMVDMFTQGQFKSLSSMEGTRKLDQIAQGLDHEMVVFIG